MSGRATHHTLSHGVIGSTPDSDSGSLGSNPGGIAGHGGWFQFLRLVETEMTSWP